MKILQMSLLASAVFLAACGGTSGSSSSSSDDSSSGGSATDIQSTADLITEPGFELNSTAALQIDITVSALANERAYLYLCEKEDTDTLNYEQCLVKTPMSGGEYSATFTLGNDVETLGLEIWTYDPTDEPDQYSWTRSEDGLDWSISS